MFVDSDLELKPGGLLQGQKGVLKKLSEFGTEGATSGEWLEASGLAGKTFYRALEVLRNLRLVERPGLDSKGEKYTLTAEGWNAVTVA